METLAGGGPNSHSLSGQITNLEFIRKAKRLNSHQARWALFNRFSFTLSFRPGSRNIKPDVLSCLFDPEPKTKQTETILPLNCVVGVVTWPIENEVKQANGGAPSPQLSQQLSFVPAALQPQVIHWAYTSLLSCHPGVKRTMFVISQRSWWPTMEPEVREYIEACPVCAQNKTSSKARMGLLQPLPIPSRSYPLTRKNTKETPQSSLWSIKVCFSFFFFFFFFFFPPL